MARRFARRDVIGRFTRSRLVAATAQFCRREWFLHNESAYYARSYQKVAIERWRTKDMTSSEPEEREDGSRERLAQTRGRNRSILDVGWYELGRQLTYKAEATGCEVVEVDPGLRKTSADPAVATLAAARGDDEVVTAGEAGISGTCASCGAPLAEPASGRAEACCSVCSNAELGDVNAAKNVLKRALFPREGEGPVEKRKVSIGIKGKKRRVAA